MESLIKKSPTLNDLFCDAFFQDIDYSNNGMSLIESKNKVEFIFSVPGVPRENISVEVEDDILDITVKSERADIVSSFNKKINISQYNSKNINAKLKDGLLTIVVEKPKKSSRKIEIK